MMRSLAAVSGLGAALFAPAFAGMAKAQPALAPISAGHLMVLGKVDALSTAMGEEVHEAAMAACLAFGAQPEVMALVLTEAGWTKDAELSFESVSTYVPPAGSGLSYIELGTEAGYCSVGSQALGGEAARGLSTGLLTHWAGEITSITEGEGEESCLKHEAKVTLPQAGTIYLSVFSHGEEDLSCDVSASESVTTYAYVRD